MIEDKNLLQRHIEKKKTNYEYFRYLITVPTTSLLVTVGFLEKIFINPEWKILATISIVSFLISVIGSVLAYTIDIAHFPDAKGEERPPGMGLAIIVLSWLGFLIGISSLAIFSIRNMA